MLTFTPYYIIMVKSPFQPEVVTSIMTCSLYLPCSLGDTRDHLLVARARQGEGPQVVKIPVTDSSPVQDLRDILSASGASMTLTDKRSWWSTRRQLDELIKVRGTAVVAFIPWLPKCSPGCAKINLNMQHFPLGYRIAENMHYLCQWILLPL